jgi:hypothetical protein
VLLQKSEVSIRELTDHRNDCNDLRQTIDTANKHSYELLVSLQDTEACCIKLQQDKSEKENTIQKLYAEVGRYKSLLRMMEDKIGDLHQMMDAMSEDKASLVTSLKETQKELYANSTLESKVLLSEGNSRHQALKLGNEVEVVRLHQEAAELAAVESHIASILSEGLPESEVASILEKAQMLQVKFLYLKTKMVTNNYEATSPQVSFTSPPLRSSRLPSLSSSRPPSSAHSTGPSNQNSYSEAPPPPRLLIRPQISTIQ